MRKWIILGTGCAAAFAFILFSAMQLKQAPRNLDVGELSSQVTAQLDEGGGSGPVRLTFEPIISASPERIRPGQAFSLNIDMNLKNVRFEDGSPLDAAHRDLLASQLGEGMKLQLHLANAAIAPSDWSPVGMDLTREWSVNLDQSGEHLGSIEKRIEIDGVAAKTADQFSFSLTVSSSLKAWTDAWGHVTAVAGLLMALGTFYFAWRTHLRQERAAKTE